jgi:hypothetical protein
MQLVLWCEIEDTAKKASSGTMGLMACEDTPPLTKLGRYEFSMDSMHLPSGTQTLPIAIKPLRHYYSFDCLTIYFDFINAIYTYVP